MTQAASSPLAGGIVWRFQSGPTLHLGIAPSGRITWQKSPVNGQGRLQPIHLHLAARIDDGRILAAFGPATTGPDFLARALQEGGLGKIPSAIVVSRDLLRDEPRLAEVATAAGTNVIFATNTYKLRQKISRHFEEFLGDQIHAHSQLGHWENLSACLPDLVGAWNQAGQQSEDDLSNRYQAASAAVRNRLGPDPRHESEREFRERRLAVGDIRLVPGAEPDFHFVGKFGDPIGYCGYDLGFVVAGTQFRAPLFSRDVPASGQQPPMTIRGFNPEGILIRRSQLPPEFRDEWKPDTLPSDTAIPLPRVLRAMLARGASRLELAILLREFLHHWTALSKANTRAVTLGSIQPAKELRGTGVVLAEGSWERIRERHFWRCIAHWNIGQDRLVGIARVQIESDGRLDVLLEHSFFSALGPELNELLRSLFLSERDLVVAPEIRRDIVVTLQARAAARASRPR